MDILISLTAENAYQESQQKTKKNINDAFINSSRAGHGYNANDSAAESQRSSVPSSIVTSREEPSKVYEEII